MPLLFVGIILIILLTVVLYKKFSKSNRRFGGFFLFLSTLVIWICSFNQLMDTNTPIIYGNGLLENNIQTMSTNPVSDYFTSHKYHYRGGYWTIV